MDVLAGPLTRRHHRGCARFDLASLTPITNHDAYISAEQVELLEPADVIFTATYGDPQESTRQEITSLWGNLSAVEAGCHFDVADDEWMIGIGLIGADITSTTSRSSSPTATAPAPELPVGGQGPRRAC